jgi:peptidoglycan L-alanyl-D-glutamate endopeptidase CwlK
VPKFSAQSIAQLDTCADALKRLFLEVIKDVDCTVLEGARTPEQQKLNVEKGVSKTLDSKHIPKPGQKALAADVAPYPLRWPQRPKDNSPEELTRWMKESARFYLFAGWVLKTANVLGIKIRWGGDWDGDWNLEEQDFDDLPHFELVE